MQTQTLSQKQVKQGKLLNQLKQLKQVSTGTQRRNTQKQLQAQIEKNQSQINSLQKSIESMRDLLKDLSNSASKIIQAKLSTVSKGGQQQKTRQVFNPMYESKKLKQLKDQKEKIFREIEQTKGLIQSIKLQQEPQIKSQILKRQIKIKQVFAALQKSHEQKKYVVEELQINKSKINSIKQSNLTKQMAQNQKFLQECKKEKTLFEKKLSYATNQQILGGLYLFEINSKIQSVDQIKQNQSTNEVSQKEIDTLLSQINAIIGKRNQIEKEKNKEIYELKNQINQLQQEKTLLTNYSRNIEGQVMKKRLEERFYKSKMDRVSKSTDFINRQFSSVQKKKKNQKFSQLQTKYSTQALDKLASTQINSLNMPRYKENLIQIGNTQLNAQCKLLRDQNLQSIEVGRIHSITFILMDNKIIGVKSTYLGKEGKKIIGDTLSIDGSEKTVEKEILVNEIKEIQYPINSKHLCLKIHRFNQSVETIGTEYYGATHKLNISLKNVKNVQFLVEKSKQGSYSKARGLIIALQGKVSMDRAMTRTEDIPSINASQQGDSNSSNNRAFLAKSPSNLKKRALSIDSITISVSTKKPVLKSLRKDTEGNLDHRLLIRKKLV